MPWIVGSVTKKNDSEDWRVRISKSNKHRCDVHTKERSEISTRYCVVPGNQELSGNRQNVVVDIALLRLCHDARDDSVVLIDKTL